MIAIDMRQKDFSEWFEFFRDSVSVKSVGEDNNGRIIMHESILMNKGGVYYTDDKFYIIEFSEIEEIISQALANGISADYEKI